MNAQTKNIFDFFEEILSKKSTTTDSTEIAIERVATEESGVIKELAQGIIKLHNEFAYDIEKLQNIVISLKGETESLKNDQQKLRQLFEIVCNTKLESEK